MSPDECRPVEVTVDGKTETIRVHGGTPMGPEGAEAMGALVDSARARMAAEPDFEGHAGRECGEHRPTGLGGRAWCFDCSEWCYPSTPCARCELPQLRESIVRLHARITALEAVDQRMADQP